MKQKAFNNTELLQIQFYDYKLMVDTRLLSFFFDFISKDAYRPAMKAEESPFLNIDILISARMCEAENNGSGVKLAHFLDDRYLSSEDSQFVDFVIDDLEEFQAQSSDQIVLLFPPVNNYLRLLIHKTVEDYKGLHSFSIGEGDQRQTVVCWTQSVIDRDQEIPTASIWPRPQEMRGRGRGRFKDRNSPSPTPGNRYGSGEEVDTRSHDMYKSEPGTTRQAAASDQRMAVQGTIQQRPGLPCQQTDSRSSPVSRQMKKAEDRMTSPASGDSGSPNRTRKPERLRNRRPDVQVYVPRARRQQTGTSGTENHVSPNRPDSTTSARQPRMGHNGRENQVSSEIPDETPRVRQKKKEMEHYVPRERRQQIGRGKETLQHVTDELTDVPNTKTHNTEAQAHAHKRIKVAEGVFDEAIMTGRKSDTWHNAAQSTGTVSDDQGSQIHDDNMLAQQNTSKHIHTPVDKCKELDSNNMEAIGDCIKHIPEVSMKSEDIDITVVEGDSLDHISNVKQPTIVTTTIPYNSSATNSLSEINTSPSSSVANMPESQEVFSQRLEEGKELAEDVARNDCENTVNSGDDGVTETAEKVSLDVASKDIIDTSDDTEDIRNDSQTKGSDVSEIAHSEMCADNYDANISDEIASSALDSDLVKCPNDFKQLTKTPVEPNEQNVLTSSELSDITSKSSTVFQDALTDQLELENDGLKERSKIKSNMECVNSDNSFKVCEDSCKAKNVNANVEEPDGIDMYKCTNQTDTAAKEIVSKDGTGSSNSGKGESESAEPMEITESCDDQREQMLEDTRGEDINENEMCDAAKMNVDSSKSKGSEVIKDSQEDVTSVSNQSKDDTGDNDIHVEDTAISGDKSKDETETNASKTDNAAINNSQSKEEEAGISQTKEEEEDEDSWDTMFDDDGECLDPTAMEELTKTVGKVKIQKSKKINYLEYQPKDKSDFDFSQYEHIIEIYGFPTEFVTRDLIIAFNDFMSRGFDLKWVDDTHALGIFNSAIAAKDALGLVNPLLKVCSLSQASKQSQKKARSCTEFLQPYKPRPETSAMAARRLVAGALGLATGVSKEKRDKERQQLKEAKAKKRQERQNRENIWEYGKCAMDEET